jgi:hypothetical protein
MFKSLFLSKAITAQSFQNLLQAKGVLHITVNVGDHNRQSLIERFNRTLESMIVFYH